MQRADRGEVILKRNDTIGRELILQSTTVNPGDTIHPAAGCRRSDVDLTELIAHAFGL